MRLTTTVLLFSFFSLFCVNANAQMINGSKSRVIQRPKAVVSQTAPVEAVNKGSNKEEVEAIIADIENELPTKMTPEQKDEIDASARKDLKIGIKYKSIRERRDLLDVLDVVERNRIRREALAAGKTPEEAAAEAAKVEKPKFNPSQTGDMEKYIFEKTNLNEQPKIRAEDVNIKQ